MFLYSQKIVSGPLGSALAAINKTGVLTDPDGKPIYDLAFHTEDGGRHAGGLIRLRQTGANAWNVVLKNDEWGAKYAVTYFPDSSTDDLGTLSATIVDRPKSNAADGRCPHCGKHHPSTNSAKPVWLPSDQTLLDAAVRHVVAKSADSVAALMDRDGTLAEALALVEGLKIVMTRDQSLIRKPVEVAMKQAEELVETTLSILSQHPELTAMPAFATDLALKFVEQKREMERQAQAEAMLKAALQIVLAIEPSLAEYPKIALATAERLVKAMALVVTAQPKLAQQPTLALAVALDLMEEQRQERFAIIEVVLRQ